MASTAYGRGRSEVNLEDILGIDPDDCLDRRARRLIEADRKLLAELVQRRKELGLKQAEVARRMDTDQGSVARIESGGRDLHQSTLRRYAMAVEAVIEHRVVSDTSTRTPAAQWAKMLASSDSPHADEAWGGVILWHDQRCLPTRLTNRADA